MPIYSFTAVDLNGRKKRDSIEAESLEAAKEKLRRQGMMVLSFGEQPSLLFWKKEEKLKNGILVTFTTQLKELIGAKIPLYESLVSLEEQYSTEKFKNIFLALSEAVKGGASLSQAMGRFPTSFSTEYVAMVEAGEKGGYLSEALEKLSQLLLRQQKIRKQLINALLYPLVLFLFSGFILFSLFFFVVPSIAPLFEERPVSSLTASVFALSYFFREKWFLSFPLLITFLVAPVALFKSKSLNPTLSLWLYRLPLWKKIALSSALSRFCRTFATLLEGGVNIIEALQKAKNVMGHPLLQEVIEKAEQEVLKGIRFSSAIASPLLPPLVMRMVAVGEESGQLPKMMHKLAEIYEGELEKTLGRVTTLAQPVILVVMGLLVGLIMMAVLLPLTDVSSFL